MKLLVIKFRVNDLDSSYGKQIEFNQRISEDFFEFKENAEKIQFIYKGLTENDINNNTIINASLVKSPARGDYKIYTNENGALFLKQFFLERLKLSSNNINDFFTLKDLGNRKYEISYIPENSEIGRFFKTRNLNNQIVNIVKESKNSNDLTRNSLQRIFYGAPGTGKSHSVKEQTKDQSFIRTTFHPDSDYASFVGCYKPTMKRYDKIYSVNELKGKLKEIKESGVTYPCHKFAAQYWMSLQDLKPDDIKTILSACGFTDSMNVEISKGIAIGQEFLNKAEDGKIIYSFTPQAFINAYVQAWKFYTIAANEGTQPKKQYLIIEEINRGNCAQIFGDLFQLLDRNKEGFSEYHIEPNEDIKNYLCETFQGMPYLYAPALYDMDSEKTAVTIRKGEILTLPPNLYIWATMNTSDQSLFPIDSAFKRRWDWQYVPIFDAKKNWKIEADGNLYDWWSFLEKINECIGATTNSEDKKLGYFFCKAENGIISAEKFVNKVIFYLWNDVFKDFGFDDEIFKDEDGSQLTFNKFYDVENGQTIIRKNKVERFLKNLGLIPLKTEDNEGEQTIPKDPSISDDGEWFKPESVIFKITDYPTNPDELYERARGNWWMAADRAEKIEYFYAYASPVQKIVACYKVTSHSAEPDNNGKIRYKFEGDIVSDDPMIGKPVETIAHAKGGVVFYPENINK